ncbi:MAG: hypothetical protein ACP6IY_22085, partial [Promethearchaeia archaeon]
FNWLDGILTYISLYILPKGLFYETNNFVYNQFVTIGFFNSFIFKISYGLFITLLIYLTINLTIDKINISKNKKLILISNNYLIFFFILIIASFLSLTFSNSLYLIIYYF